MPVDTRARHTELTRQVGQPHRATGTCEGFENLSCDDHGFDRTVAAGVLVVLIFGRNHDPI